MQGVKVAALEREFGAAVVAPALEAVERLAEAGLVVFDGGDGSAVRAGTAAVERCLSGVFGAGGARGGDGPASAEVVCISQGRIDAL